MNITLIRTKRTRWALDGELWISGKKVCDTTENLRHHLEEGTYKLELKRDPRPGRYRQKVPTIVGVSNGAITYGNGVEKLRKKDVLIGKLQCSGLCIHGRETFRHLIERMTKAKQRTKQSVFTLTVV